MFQSEASVGKMYRVRPGMPGNRTFCKVHQYGQTWLKILKSDHDRRWGGADVLVRYPPGQAILAMGRNDGNQVEVLVGGENLTLQGRSWRSIVEVGS